MVEFGGWVMPVQYAGITIEHIAVRKKVGIFDTSHMGEIEIRGRRAEMFLDWLLPNTIRGLAPGMIIYSPMCNEYGGIIDDLLVYKRGDTHFLLVVNAARTTIDVQWVVTQAKAWNRSIRWAEGEGSSGVAVEDTSDAYGMIALQGPEAEETTQKYAEVNIHEIGYYHFTEGKVDGIHTLISRTGYTGEDGFEMLCRIEDVGRVWDMFIEEAHVTPCGLGARDTLRTEMGYALYGHELTEEVTPLEANLAWTVHCEKDEFIGKDALIRQKKQGISRKSVGLLMEEQAIPRSGQRILSEHGEQVGYVTSGTFSPSFKQGIGLSYIQMGYEKSGARVSVEIRGRAVKAKVIKPPFVTPHVKRLSRTQTT
jgi:aminomethyltransferase